MYRSSHINYQPAKTMKTEKYNYNGEIISRVYIDAEDYYYTSDECADDEILEDVNESDLIKLS